MNGWKIVCPDDAERHYPYLNHGDAEHDARVFSEPGRCDGCPGGAHEVVPCVYDMPAGSRMAGEKPS